MPSIVGFARRRVRYARKTHGTELLLFSVISLGLGIAGYMFTQRGDYMGEQFPFKVAFITAMALSSIEWLMAPFVFCCVIAQCDRVCIATIVSASILLIDSAICFYLFATVVIDSAPYYAMVGTNSTAAADAKSHSIAYAHKAQKWNQSFGSLIVTPIITSTRDAAGVHHQPPVVGTSGGGCQSNIGCANAMAYGEAVIYGARAIIVIIGLLIPV